MSPAAAFDLLSHGRPSGSKPSQGRVSSTPLYTLFSPAQIKQFQEAFNLIDSDRDGLITTTDLTTTLQNLGLPPSPPAAFLPPGAKPGTDVAVNFTTFLTMMGEKLLKMDKEDELNEAFGSFDEADEGVVRVDEVRKWLRETGDKMTDQEIDSLLSSRFVDKKGMLHYREFTASLKVNDPNADEAEE